MTIEDKIPTFDEETLVVEQPVSGNWAHRNLFSTWYNSAMTVVFGLVAVGLTVSIVRFLFASDYEILRVNLTLLMVGRYPRDELWRVVTAFVGFGFVGGLVTGRVSVRARADAIKTSTVFVPTPPLALVRRLWPGLLVTALILALTTTVGPTLVVVGVVVAVIVGYLAGRGLPTAVDRWWWVLALAAALASYLVLAAVEWDDWGGLLTNVFLTVAGIALAFPLGLVLALGRRSTLPIFRYFSVGFIELIRGVPLITLLLMGVFALGFFVPEGLRPRSNTVRVLVAIVFFESAYIAEVVRGGLQSVPKGQTEAGQALGMSPFKIIRQIVMPQSLRATIPAMVGQFISLFKDTSLVSLAALFDLLGYAQNVTSQPDFLGRGLNFVTLPFAGLIFWAGSYTMSREARRLERKLGVGER